MEREVAVSRDVQLGFEWVRDALRRNTDEVLSDTVGAPADGGTTLQQKVRMQVGELHDEGAAAHLPVHWDPEAHCGLLPSFDGELVIERYGEGTHLELRGHYRIPLGVVGRFGDGIVGRRVARRSLEDFVEEMAVRLEAVAADRSRVLQRRSPHAVTYRDIGPDVWLG